MTLLEELKQSGVNVDEGLERVMGAGTCMK